MARSLSFKKFQLRLTEDLRTYWYYQTAFEYSRRWWETRTEAELPQTLAQNPGDRGRPYSGVDISVSEFLDLGPRLASILSGNTIINTVTAFEVYLQDSVKRIVYVDPARMFDSEMTFTGGDVAAAIAGGVTRRWFADEVARRYMYNKSHGEMITRLGSLLGRNLKNAHKSELAKWNRIIVLRNALVHTGRQVTSSLKHAWPERFGSTHSATSLGDNDVIVCHAAAFALAESLDRHIQEVVLKKEDQYLLAREIFVQFGLQDASGLAREVSALLQCRFSKNDAERALARQRRYNSNPSEEFDFTPEMLKR